MNKTILIILDGWGLAASWGGNAISLARLPNFNNLWQKMPHSVLKASGQEVGLPGHEMGNSEVGHLNLGAGRIVRQDSSRINETIENGSFFQNEVLKKAIAHAKQNNSKLHLMGLVSDGGIHSHINHLFALLDLCQKENFHNVFIHGITDGRDTDPMSGIIYFNKLEEKLKSLGFGKIATVSGRYFAMDRDNHWDRIERAYQAIANGVGEKTKSPLAAISLAYSRHQTDEFIAPTVVCDENNFPVGKVETNDSVIFFNFRSDRARQITLMFAEKKPIANLYFVTLIPYGFEGELSKKIISAFEPNPMNKVLAQVISELNFCQFHTAETEKYAHVTYFFNGGRETPFPNEERKMIPSPAVATFDLKPEMAASEVVGSLVERLRDKKLPEVQLIILNFANADMVGHTGNLQAAVKAVEAVDLNLGELLKAPELKDFNFLITADHGNVEQMINPITGDPDTEHTTNPVPFILKLKNEKNIILRPEGRLADVTPTILEIAGITQPADMTGQSLINKEKIISNNPLDSKDILW